MKEAKGILKTLRYICLSCVIVLGLITIVGSNGGGGDSSTSTTDGGDSSTSTTDDEGSEIVATSLTHIAGTLEVPPGVDESERQEATVFIIGQESQGVQTDINGDFTLLVSVVSSASREAGSRAVEEGTEYDLIAISQTKNYGRKVDGIIVIQDQVTTVPPITITKSGSITGNVTLQGQSDHTGIMVYIPGTSFIAMTDSSGDYTISQVPEGVYDFLAAEKDGYHTGTLANITVESDTTTTVPSMELLLSTGAEGQLVLIDGALYCNSFTVDFIITSSEDAVLMMVSEDALFVDAQWEAVQSNVSYTFTEDGEKTLYIKFADANGLETTPISVTLTIDTTGPMGTLLIDGGSDYVSDTEVTLTIDGEDQTTISEMMISNDENFTDAEWEDYATTKEWSLTSGEGEKTVYMKLKDVVGNVSGVIQATVTLDTTLLNPSASAGDGQITISWDSVTGAASYNIYWSTSTGVSTTDYEGKIEDITETSYNFTGLTNGTTYYYVVTAENSHWESDESSEVSATPNEITPPTISLVSPAVGATGVAVGVVVSATFSETMDASTITTDTFTLSAEGSNIDGTVAYSEQTATFTPSSNLNYNTTYTASIAISVKDLVGNPLESAYTWSFRTPEWYQATDSAAFLARRDLGLVAYDNKMWVIGGDVNGNEVWYSTDGTNWTEATDSAAFSAREEHAVAVYNDKMWVIGGYVQGVGFKNDVWYSTDGIDWTEATANAAFSTRRFPSLVVYDNKMWVIGGRDSGNTSLNDVWYSTDGIDWTEATANAAFSKRYADESLVYDNKMWVIAGRDGTVPGPQDVWYSTNGADWTKATDNAAFPARTYYAATVYDNKMWVIGGSDGGGVLKNDLWYSADGINWTEVISPVVFSARERHASVVHDNKIWVIGGWDGARKNDVWFYTKATD